MGTRSAIPVSLLWRHIHITFSVREARCSCTQCTTACVAYPFSSGMTLPTALAASVDAGMMFWLAPRPLRQSFPDGVSTVFYVAVTVCTVVINPSTIPNLSCTTLASGARQFVVHDALLMM